MLFGSYARRTVNIVPYIIIFLVVTVSYSTGRRKLSGSSMFFAGLCTFTFMGFQKLMYLFIDVNKYNVIYGVLSNTIVLLMEIFFFFVIFLFFGQYFFVYKYFDLLLISEMYLLPEYSDTGLFSTFKRMLFIRPDALLSKENNILRIKKDEYIYRQGDKGDGAFYLIRGTVQILHLNSVSYVDPGKIFGEEACMLEGIHNGDAVAKTDVELVKIPDSVFFDVLESNPKVSAKALSRISRYFAKFYGRN
jgi:membrane protein